MVVSGVPSFTKMKFLFVTGEPDAVGGGVTVAVGDGVGVGVGEGVVLVVPVGVIDGEGVSETDGEGETDGVGDGEMVGTTTAPPTAWPSRHTYTYSVAPGGGFTSTGVGDGDGEATTATAGGEVVGVIEGFTDGVWLGGATGGAGLLVGKTAVATEAGACTGDAELADAADAADADWAATCCLMPACVVMSPWLPLTSRPTCSTAVRVTAVMTTQDSSQPSASVSGRAGSRRPAVAGARRTAEPSRRHHGPGGPEVG
jgi:hypothetical protein